MKFLKWGFVILLAAFLVFMGAQKFGGPNPIFHYIANSTGMAFFEPQVRLLTGVAEIVAAALLVWPRTRMLGAYLSLAVLGGALLFHLSPFLGINAPVAFNADGGYVKSPALFIMASSFFVVTLALIYVERVTEKPPAE
ncbi:hypothetical protein MNBD_ALPHA06-798 [hydrothermal vent metagenome]|uniref:DoxX family protein n=1 Tax=hydrothermal vent metagenome TaxID=652676 RepID=A0A3B0RMY0_9ZZZZ